MKAARQWHRAMKMWGQCDNLQEAKDLLVHYFNVAINARNSLSGSECEEVESIVDLIIAAARESVNPMPKVVKPTYAEKLKDPRWQRLVRDAKP